MWFGCHSLRRPVKALARLCKCGNTSTLKIVNEYYQELPNLQIADKPVAPHGRATQQSGDIAKQQALSSPSR